jgi:CubicO group peptidase (beta-lactamase class C family)
LLRHTAGFTYEFSGDSAVQKMYREAKVSRRDQTNADHAATLAKLPLAFQPGTRWEYGRATDVLGRLLEAIEGKSLAELLTQRILDPLGMTDTGFHAPAAEHDRLAEPFERDPDTGGVVSLIDVRQPPMFQSGGGGLVSTAMDYARFLQMLLNGGTLGGVRLLGRKTVEFMTADHVGPVPGVDTLAGPGHGFGLGFAVRLADGIAATPGSAGQYFWGGVAGTAFWVDPREELAAVLMMQGPGQREYYRALFRALVYGAFGD